MLEELEYKEWAVTVTFYGALHYVEAGLSQIAGIEHSETSMPPGWTKSIHAWREDLVFTHFSNVYQEYRKLSNASMITRYLWSGGAPGVRGTPIGQPAEDFFADDDVGKFINRDLDRIKRKIGVKST